MAGTLLSGVVVGVQADVTAWAFTSPTAAAIAAVIMVVVVAVWLQLRHRRQIAALMARLDRLETHSEDGPSAAMDSSSAGLETPPPDVPGVADPALSRDVLVGHTTHVERVLGGARGGRLTLADQAIVKIHQHLADTLTPQRLAYELCVSLRTLERGLALSLSCTPRQLILAMKMRAAKKMLLEGERVGEVGAQVGFSNPFHFSRRFKEFYHVAPSQLRPAGRGE